MCGVCKYWLHVLSVRPPCSEELCPCHFSGISWLQSSAEFSHRFALACKCLVGFSSSVMRPSVSALITVGNVRRPVFPVRQVHVSRHFPSLYKNMHWRHIPTMTCIHLYCVSLRSYTSYGSIVDFSVFIAFFVCIGKVFRKCGYFTIRFNS